MKIDGSFKRMVRIYNDPRGLLATGSTVHVQDVQTGEHIQTIKSIMIYLYPSELNKAVIAYYTGNYGETGDIILDDPIIDITAYEVNNDRR